MTVWAFKRGVRSLTLIVSWAFGDSYVLFSLLGLPVLSHPSAFIGSRKEGKQQLGEWVGEEEMTTEGVASRRSQKAHSDGVWAWFSQQSVCCATMRSWVQVLSTHMNKLGISVHPCNPDTEKVETRKSLACHCVLISEFQWETPNSTNKEEVIEEDRYVAFWLPSKCILCIPPCHTHIWHTHTHS